MVRFVEFLIVGARLEAFGASRNDRPFSGFAQRFKYPGLGLEALVGDHGPSTQAGQQRIGAVQFALLTRGQVQPKRIAQGIDHRMDLGAQPAFAAADGFIAPFLRAPALCWWARTMVASMIA